VTTLVKDGPGEKAGLKPGDVILGVNDRVVETSAELPTVIARIRPGETAKLNVLREGKEQKINVKVDALDEPQMQTASLKGGADKNGNLESLTGLSVRPLDPRERAQVETEGSLVVENVSGPALAAGVERGDIILAVNGKKVKSLSELQAAAKSAGKTVALLLQRSDGSTAFLPLRLS
jgi:serine protease Do